MNAFSSSPSQLADPMILKEKYSNPPLCVDPLFQWNLSRKKKAQIRVRRNKFYKLQLKYPMALIGSYDEKDLNELWHRRMGHLHHGTLRILKKTITRVPYLSTKRDDIFRGCVLGNYTKAAYPRSRNRAKSLFRLIQSHICGSISTRAPSGVVYFITLIDDHYKKTWI